MVTIHCNELNLGQICDSGQCFRMRKLSGTSAGDLYEIISADRRVTATQLPDGAAFDCTEDEYESYWGPYFDIDCGTDYAAIIASIDPADEYLTEAARLGSGIRILRQDPWEMIVTFLISQQNNIPRIHKCIDNICDRYGRHIAPGDPAGAHTYPPGEQVDEFGYDTGFHAFPTPESLASLGDDDLMPCNLGYRSKYVVRTARQVVNGTLDPDALAALGYREARERLLSVYGIGQKVADCICLFALHHLEAFPVDTHIAQVLEREYGGSGRVMTVEDTPLMRYRDYLGVIQQYMFYRELMGDV